MIYVGKLYIRVQYNKLFHWLTGGWLNGADVQLFFINYLLSHRLWFKWLTLPHIKCMKTDLQTTLQYTEYIVILDIISIDPFMSESIDRTCCSCPESMLLQALSEFNCHLYHFIDRWNQTTPQAYTRILSNLRSIRPGYTVQSSFYSLQLVTKYQNNVLMNDGWCFPLSLGQYYIDKVLH